MDQDLSDARWELIRPLLPAAKRRGRPRAEDRRTLNGILHVLRSGCRWQDMPRRYDSSVTCWRPTGPVANQRHLGRHLEGFPGHVGLPRQAGLDPSLSGRDICPG